VELTRDELSWISNALNEVLNGPDAIDEWEFHMRIGGSREEVDSLRARMHEEAERIR
jgi:hypothetical protein